MAAREVQAARAQQPLRNAGYHDDMGTDFETGALTEARLIAGLQPIRQFVLAQALYHFMNLGIQEAIDDSVGGCTVRELASRLKLHERRLQGFLSYFENEGYVSSVGDRVLLTATGKQVADLRPWYELLVGGYAPTFQQLSTVLQDDGPYATRNTANVGRGSCGISQHDALPMTRRLLARIEKEWRTVVDLGCGDGSYLVDLCRSLPRARGIGIDSEPASVNAALQSAERHGIRDRVDIRLGAATNLSDLSADAGPFCFITAFVLQEILEQEGRSRIVDLLKGTFDRFPEAHWVVIEVDHQPRDPRIRTGLGVSYYNPYYLLHHLTEQRLETTNFWHEVFRDAGLSVEAVEYPEPSYDSMRLKVGFLLGRPPHKSSEDTDASTPS
jgi:2-ketoarginine methyltransferase